jgi:hypothetical protein
VITGHEEVPVTHRLHRTGLALATLIVLAMLAYLLYPRWLGGSPTYSACVAAMEKAAAGQSATEVERHMASW